MAGLQKLETAVFHVRDVAPYQLEFKAIAVVRTAEKYCLIHEPHTLFTIGKNCRNDVFGFGITVLDRYIGWFAAALLFRKQILLVLPLTLGDQAIGAVENRLRRPVILLKTHDPRRRHVLVGKIQNIVDLGRTKGINRLCIVADYRHAVSIGFDGVQNIGLQQVRVLILIDQHVIEPGAYFCRKLGVGDQVTPVQQKVIVIE